MDNLMTQLIVVLYAGVFAGLFISLNMAKDNINKYHDSEAWNNSNGIAIIGFCFWVGSLIMYFGLNFYLACAIMMSISIFCVVKLLLTAYGVTLRELVKTNKTNKTDSNPDDIL